jgi:hypothetical protein
MSALGGDTYGYWKPVLEENPRLGTDSNEDPSLAMPFLEIRERCPIIPMIVILEDI